MAKERPPLEEMTLRQLRQVAQEYAIARYSRMRKAQLVAAIQNAQMAAGHIDASEIINVANQQASQAVEATKLNPEELSAENLAAVDRGLGELPGGYGKSLIVLLPRDPQWAYVYWDVPNEERELRRQQGGQDLALRLYDATGLDLSAQAPHSIQEYPCDELARDWYLPVPLSDRDYVAELGYRTNDGRWLVLARSAAVRVPPLYPTDWVDDRFATVPWEREPRSRTLTLTTSPVGDRPTPDLAALAQEAEAERMAGSLYGSQQMAESAITASGVGMSASGIGITASGVGMGASGIGITASGVGMSASGIGITASGVGMSASGIGRFAESSYALSSYIFPSGVGMWTGEISGPAINYSGFGQMSGMGLLSYSGFGLSSAAWQRQPRQFWLVADAELIVYGATEPDASVTVGGRPIELHPDGTFRYHMSFQDGLIDFPIFALAADGVQNRVIHMRFERQTLERRTNTKEEAIPEWIDN